MNKLVTGIPATTDRKLAVAAAHYHMSGNGMVRAAIDAMLQTLAERDGTLHAAFDGIDRGTADPIIGTGLEFPASVPVEP